MNTRATGLLLLALAANAWADMSATLKVPPGYTPDDSSKWDEQGLWMEMSAAERHIERSPLLLPRDTDLARHVEATACLIAGDYCNDLRVYTIKNHTFNASMAPNGTMIVHTGLLLRVESTEQLAAVLGHELAHYTQAHSLRRFRAAKNRMAAGSLISMGLAAGGIGAGGLPEMFALASVMGFTRTQESEADELGAYFMSQSGLNPRAAAAVWSGVSEEERRASVKRPKGSAFLSSHPSPQRRQKRLESIAGALSPVTGATTAGDSAEDPMIDALGKVYPELMELQVAQGDFGRLMTMLERHAAMGLPASDVNFYMGEAWRTRRGAGDHEKAMSFYSRSMNIDNPNLNSIRELGFLEMKYGDSERGKDLLRRYLTMKPDAPDKAMIEFQIEGGW